MKLGLLESVGVLECGGVLLKNVGVLLELGGVLERGAGGVFERDGVLDKPGMLE